MDHGAKADVKNKDGQTPLDLARGNEEMLAVLLRTGAPPAAAVGPKGETEPAAEPSVDAFDESGLPGITGSKPRPQSAARPRPAVSQSVDGALLPQRGGGGASNGGAAQAPSGGASSATARPSCAKPSILAAPGPARAAAQKSIGAGPSAASVRGVSAGGSGASAPTAPTAAAAAQAKLAVEVAALQERLDRLSADSRDSGREASQQLGAAMAVIEEQARRLEQMDARLCKQDEQLRSIESVSTANRIAQVRACFEPSETSLSSLLLLFSTLLRRRTPPSRCSSSSRQRRTSGAPPARPTVSCSGGWSGWRRPRRGQRRLPAGTPCLQSST